MGLLLSEKIPDANISPQERKEGLTAWGPLKQNLENE